MSATRHRCAPTAGRLLLPSLLALLVAASFAFRAVAQSAVHEPRGFGSLDALLRAGAGERLDWGTIDIFQTHASEPTAWVFVEDSTLDGDGTEYWIYSDQFIPPSPTNDDLSLRFDYADGVSHANLQACLDWIVATYPSVGSQSQLVIHKHVVTTVP